MPPTTEISISKYQLCWGFFNAAILLACIFKVFFDLILCMCGTIWKLFVCILILQRPSQDDHEICNLKRAIKCFSCKFVDAPPHCWLLVCTLPQLSSTRLFSIGFCLHPCPRGVLPPIYSIGFEAIWLWAFLHAKLGSLPSAFFHFCAALLFFFMGCHFFGPGFLFHGCLHFEDGPLFSLFIWASASIHLLFTLVYT